MQTIFAHNCKRAHAMYVSVALISIIPPTCAWRFMKLAVDSAYSAPCDYFLNESLCWYMGLPYYYKLYEDVIDIDVYIHSYTCIYIYTYIHGSCKSFMIEPVQK